MSFAQIEQKETSKIDSIISLRKQAANKNLSPQERFSLAERARRMSLQLGVDSTIVRSNLEVSSAYYRMRNYNLFKKINRETLPLAKKIGDSSSTAKINFNIGNYFYVKLESDSAYYYYYNSEKIYTELGDAYNAGRVLLNMAIIQKNEKDYIGSEGTSVKAIKFLEPYLKSKPQTYRPLSSAYNNLAIVSKELQQYNRAIEYYNQAITLIKKSDNRIRELNYRNNLALIYEKLEDYSKAQASFSELLSEEKLIEKDSFLYARIANNYARNRFLENKDDENLPKLFTDALKIRENIDDKAGVMRSNIDISNYYLAHSNLELAKMHVLKAYNIAHKYNRNDDELEALLLLSKIEKGDTALAYTQEYIKLNDSLHKEERAIRNKFARIEFETDRIEEQNVKISREREIFLILAIAGLVSAFLIYIIISQRGKNKELKFNQEQQKANEEIYNLMLSQQDKIEEGRAKEKQRISEDLHDGILGRLFGTRLSLDSLNMSSDENAVKNRGQYLDELKSIEEEIRRISHDLNSDFVVGSGYLDIVKTLIDNQTQAYGLTYKFNHKDEIDWESVSNKTKIHFYRMIQESMQNIYKHANAKHVDISFETRKKTNFSEYSG